MTVCLLLLLALTVTSPALAENTITAVGAGFSSNLGGSAPEPTVHRAEFGDGPSDLIGPARPQAPRPEPPPPPIFRASSFIYGESLRYEPGTRLSNSAFDYQPGARLDRDAYQPEAGEWMRRRYEGTGEHRHLRRTYRPDIRYGEGLRRSRRPHRFGDK